MEIKNTDAVTFIKSLEPNSLQCIICDPPFGLGEDSFDKHYARDSTNVLEGYTTAPQNPKEYQEWATSWIKEIPRVLKPDGTFYIICAWNHLCDIELAIRESKLKVFNHIIWKYNFGVYTQKKFVTSHYHILRCGKKQPAFYNRAFFNETEKTPEGGSAQYLDMEDVWIIPKEFHKGEKKNINKLPDALVKKLILYSTKQGDTVGDFFLGNFTTAYVAKKQGRKFVGCEINKEIFDHHLPLLQNIVQEITDEKNSTKPKNKGKTISDSERKNIKTRFEELYKTKTKKDSIAILEKEFERGYFSILNILKETN